MAVNFTDNVRVGQQKPIDDKYFNGFVPYISVSQVNSLILPSVRHRGLTVNINGEEYWYKDGIGDSNLVLKVYNIDTSNFVTYTGATKNVNIGSYFFESANGFKKTGGSGSQYLMADGTTSTLPTDLIKGTGTENYIPKFSSSGVLTNSIIYDNGTNVSIGDSISDARLRVKAQGTNATDIAFRVRNSANTQDFLVVNGAGDVVIGGNLTVKGATTIIESNIVSIGDNIIELNGTLGSYGGLIVKDQTQPNTVSGSLLWDTYNDKWIGGPLGNEEGFIQETEFNSYTSSINEQLDGIGIWKQTGSYYATTNDLQVTGSVKIKGDLIVEGQTTLIQKLDPESESLVVSGAMTIIQNQINDQIVSASLTIQGLGTLSDTNNNTVIDLGGFF